MRMNRVLEVDYENQIAVVEPGLVNLAPLVEGRPPRLLLRARSLEPAGVHDRRQRRQQLRRPAHPEVRRHDESRARPRGRHARRRDRVGSAARRGRRAATTWPASSSAPRARSGSPRDRRAHPQEAAGRKTVLAVFDAIDQAVAQRCRPSSRRGLVPAAMEMIDQLTIQAVEDAFHCGYPRDAGGGAAHRARRARRRDGRAGRAHRRGLPRVGRARGAHGADEAERQLLWKGRKSRVWRVRPRVAGLHGDGRRHPAHASFRTCSAGSNEIVADSGLRVGNVFHAGDGNLHPNILYDPRKPGEEARVVAAGAEIMKRVRRSRWIDLRRARHRPRESRLHAVHFFRRGSCPDASAEERVQSVGWQPGQDLPDEEVLRRSRARRVSAARDRRKGPRPALLARAVAAIRVRRAAPKAPHDRRRRQRPDRRRPLAVCRRGPHARGGGFPGSVEEVAP